MTYIPRHLITTADERTWRFDRPVIFLGEWCRLYERREIWSGMDAIVAEPFGLGLGEKAKHIEYLQKVSGDLLVELTGALNKIHLTNHDTRYWNILLGDWLQRFVHVVFNRFHTIDSAFRKYKISGTSFYNSNKLCRLLFNIPRLPSPFKCTIFCGDKILFNDALIIFFYSD